MSIDPITSGILTNATGNLTSSGVVAVASRLRDCMSNSFEVDFSNFELEAERLEAIRNANEWAIWENKTRTSSDFYQQWRSKVNHTLREAATLKSQLNQGSGLFSSSWNGSDLCRRVQRIHREVQVLLESGKFREQFLVDKPPEPVVKMNPPDIKKYQTLENHLQEILKRLRCDRVRTICISGPLGIGKTTIMQNLNDHDEVAKSFDIVIWLQVSNWDREKLLKKISKRLNMNLQDPLDTDEVAESILEKLRDKKLLLLLDMDVRDRIDLPGIGIPNNNNGSKVVFTTKFSRVHRSMADSVINVNPLSADEAWYMFREIVSDTVDGPGVEPIARLVAAECSGLPFLINQVACSFKQKKYSYQWRNGLEQLRNWPKARVSNITEVYGFIKFCYDELNDEQKKRCFLYVALHPIGSKVSIDYLVKSWAAEMFPENGDDCWSFRRVCDQGYAILDDLTDVLLLQPCRSYEHVQVNHVVRQFAIHISSEEYGGEFLVGETNGHGQAKRIFMIDRKLDHLQILPSCSELVSLLLHKNPNLKTLPLSFFETMNKLLVLNLYRTGMEALPQSFKKLTTLKALFLNQCVNLTDLPPQIEKFLVLEVLDIRGCKVTFIPLLIGNLVSLKCLRVSYNKPSRVVSPTEREQDCSVISRLSKLEDLVIDVMSDDQWRIEAIHIIRHVASLENLTSLKIHFPKLEDMKPLLESGRGWQDRDKFSLWASVGHPSQGPPEISGYLDRKIERYLRYSPEGQGVHCPTSNMFPETDVLELIGHNSITCLSQFMKDSGLDKVRSILVKDCTDLVTLVDGNIMGGTNTLSELHTIVVKNCRALTSCGLIQQLPKVKKLVIHSCSNIEELLPSSGVGSIQNLEVLELFDLAKLRTISEDTSFACPRLKELIVRGCAGLKILPFKKKNAAMLKFIEGEQNWWGALQWDDESKQHFMSTFRL